MKPIQRLGVYADTVTAPSPNDPSATVTLGLRSQTLAQYAGHDLRTVVAQYYGIVKEDLMSARHLFRGLERYLSFGDDMKADENVLVYTWRSQVDYEWQGSQFNGIPVVRTPRP